MLKYQVFLSSVSEELKQHREAIIRTLLKTNRYFPVAMEFFLAYDNTLKLLYRYLEDSDVYVLILKDSGGSAIGETNAKQLSRMSRTDRRIAPVLAEFCKNTGKTAAQLTYTQVEYIFARAFGLRMLPFVYEDDAVSLPERFRSFSGTLFDSAARPWHTADDLSRSVIDSLDFLVNDGKNADMGWMRRSSDPTLNKMRSAGIRQLKLDGGGFVEELKERLSDVTELNMFFTTGRNMILNNQALLAALVASGGTIRLLCAAPGHEFLSDVAEVERFKYGNRDDIHTEFLLLIQTLGHIYVKAREDWRKAGAAEQLGKIVVGNARTLFRSSILFARMKDESKWGWLTLTLPPEKSVDMISLELEQNAGSESSDELMQAVANHFDIVWKTAEQAGDTLVIDAATDFAAENERFSRTERAMLANRPYWEKKAVQAQRLARRRRGGKVLIEVAAQHPLEDGLFPGREFAARLDYAVRLMEEKKAENREVEIYVPGSVHLDEEGVADEVSLSEAGVEYLKKKGVDPSVLHGEDLNHRYDSVRYWRGVYNSADECWIAAQYFLEEGSGFSDLLCVCSPNQAMRKTLLYLNQGITAMVYTVPVDSMYHKPVAEVYDAIPFLLSTDPDCQAPDSPTALRSRRERMPDFDG